MKSSRDPRTDTDTTSLPLDEGHAGANVRLDEAAYRMLAALEHASDPHKAGLAAVHRARAEIAANPDLEKIPLSEVVSALTRIADLPYLGEEYIEDPDDGSGRTDLEPADLRLALIQPRNTSKSDL